MKNEISGMENAIVVNTSITNSSHPIRIWTHGMLCCTTSYMKAIIESIRDSNLIG